MKKNCKHRAVITREACCENRKKDNQLQRVLETGAGRVHKVNGNGLYTFHTTTKYYYDLPATANEIIVTVKLKFKTGTVKEFKMKI